jgi:hypothetical protein
MDGSKIIIFTETKRGADQLTRQLRMDGWPALAIHGDKSQSERDWVLNEFRDGKNPIMIATDVAARGLGILLGRCTPLLFSFRFFSPTGWQESHYDPTDGLGVVLGITCPFSFLFFSHTVAVRCRSSRLLGARPHFRVHSTVIKGIFRKRLF